MTITTLRSQYATWVQKDRPTANWFHKTGYMSLYGVTGRNNMGIIWFTNPFPVGGANVAKATLTLKTRAVAGTGASQMTVQLCDKWSSHFGAVNWNTRPAGKLAQSSLTKTNPLGNNTAWQFDVTAQMQAIASGEPFYGFVITTQSQHQILVQGNMSATLDPSLVVQWQTNPLPPADLSPSTGQSIGTGSPILRFTYRDTVGGDSIASVHVRTGTSETTVSSSPTFDSGEVLTTQAQFDLSTASGWTPPAKDTVVWWQVRCRDSSGLWSGWSTPASWKWHALPVVELVQPDPSGSSFSDPTPPISWKFTGDMPQVRWAVSIDRLQGSKWVRVARSGVVLSNERDWTPEHTGLAQAGTVRINVECWDGRLREAVPGYPVSASASSTFTFSPTTTVAPVTGLVAKIDPILPRVVLEWNRDEVPDRIDVYRDGRLLSSHEGLDWFVSGTLYRMTDAACPGGPHTWLVYAIVNGKASKSTAVTAKSELTGTWLIDEDSGDRVWVQSDLKHDMAMPETTTTFQPVGGHSSIVVTSAQYGYEGTLTGELVDVIGLPATETAALWRDRLSAWKSVPGKKIRMLTEGLDFDVYMSEITFNSTHPWTGTRWTISLKFHQIDRFLFGDD